MSIISQITGTVVHKDETGIEINLANISLYCLTPRALTYPLNTLVTFYTHLAWNPEQGPILFAFESFEEKEMFLLLTTCSGIGPKGALNILNSIDYRSLIHAILLQQTETLTEIPGIGKKKAEMIIVELKNKVSKINPATSASSALSEALDALKALGYKHEEVLKAIKVIQNETSSDWTTEEYISKALKTLSNL